MIAGILLAAGESKRFRSENKLLYEISPGTTIIECSLKTFINSQVDKIIVVVGFQHKHITQKIQPIIDSSKIPLEIIFNPHFQVTCTDCLKKSKHVTNKTNKRFITKGSRKNNFTT